MTKNSNSSTRALKPAKQSGGFYMVALGASAGGLEALVAFFTAMPSNSNAGFIVVTHLAPTLSALWLNCYRKTQACLWCKSWTA